MMPMGWPMGGGYGWGWGLFGLFFMLLFWVLVIVGVVFLVRWLVEQSRPQSSGGGETALDILKKRYARGEINREEFEAKKRDLA
jgi:putative membrane protein